MPMILSKSNHGSRALHTGVLPSRFSETFPNASENLFFVASCAYPFPQPLCNICRLVNNCAPIHDINEPSRKSRMCGDKSDQPNRDYGCLSEAGWDIARAGNLSFEQTSIKSFLPAKGLTANERRKCRSEEAIFHQSRIFN